jgi:NTE family protein
MNSNIINPKQKSLGLALSGGGARGLAHIGVLKVLVEQSIDISCISGCSMGGLVGALYSVGYSVEEIENIATKYTTIREMINIVDRSPRRRGLIVGQRLRTLLAKIFGKETTFKDIKIPLTLNAVDLITSREIALSDGNLLDAVMSTIAVPGFFAPVLTNEMQLIDGGTLNNLPVDHLFPYNPEVTLAIDVHPDTKHEIPWQVTGQKPRILFPLPDFFLDYYRAQMIMISQMTEQNLSTYPPSLLIRPNLPTEYTMFYGYQHASKIIAQGEKAARKNLTKIKELLIQ